MLTSTHLFLVVFLNNKNLLSHLHTASIGNKSLGTSLGTYFQLLESVKREDKSLAYLTMYTSTPTGGGDAGGQTQVNVKGFL